MHDSNLIESVAGPIDCSLKISCFFSLRTRQNTFQSASLTQRFLSAGSPILQRTARSMVYGYNSRQSYYWALNSSASMPLLQGKGRCYFMTQKD